MAGFVTAASAQQAGTRPAAQEGCFFVGIRESDKYTAGFQIYLVFLITQHVRDEALLRGLINYLGCGNLRSKREVFEYQVSKYSDLIEKIIPFFNKYQIFRLRRERREAARSEEKSLRIFQIFVELQS